MTSCEKENNFNEAILVPGLVEFHENNKCTRILKVSFALVSVALVLLGFGYITWNSSRKSNQSLYENDGVPLTDNEIIPLTNPCNNSGSMAAKFEIGEYGYMVITDHESFKNFNNYREELSLFPGAAGVSLADKIQGLNL